MKEHTLKHTEDINNSRVKVEHIKSDPKHEEDAWQIMIVIRRAGLSNLL